MLLDKIVGRARHLAATLALISAGRFAFVEARAWSEPVAPGLSSPRLAASSPAQPSGPTNPAEMVEQASHHREQILEQFKDELASASPVDPAAPAVAQRHIFVDFGPPRSKVYIAGKLVGQTPFGGQISCREGKGVEVVVLPEQGAPLSRTYQCLTGPQPAASTHLPVVPSAGLEISNLKPPAAH